MGTIDLRYLHRERSRHGKLCFYVRYPGKPRVRVSNPDDPACVAEAFRMARNETLTPKRHIKSKRRNPKGSLGAICTLYFASEEFKRLNTKTQAVRRGILDSCVAEPWEGDTDWLYGDCPIVELRPRDIKNIRDRKTGLPEAANGRVKALRALFEWAVGEEHVERNVAKDVALISTATDGHHTWSVEEVHQYERTHPVGTMARLALALLLYTGQRRSDVVLLGRQHLSGGWLSFTQQKNKANAPVKVDIPVLPQLAEVIAATPSKGLAFLETVFGQPFTGNGFGNRMRKWCDDAGLAHCTAHGLRKAGATIAAENGATEAQLMAIFGWSTLKEASRYTRAARRKRLAGDAMHLLVPTQSANDSPAPAEGLQKVREAQPKKRGKSDAG